MYNIYIYMYRSHSKLNFIIRPLKRIYVKLQSDIVEIKWPYEEEEFALNLVCFIYSHGECFPTNTIAYRRRSAGSTVWETQVGRYRGEEHSQFKPQHA